MASVNCLFTHIPQNITRRTWGCVNDDNCQFWVIYPFKPSDKSWKKILSNILIFVFIKDHVLPY